MSKYSVQRPRHLGGIERVDEQGRGLDLPAAVGAEEAPKLLLIGPFSPRGLLLEGAERFKITLSVKDVFHEGGTEGADQLVLQVCDAHVETERFHIAAREIGAEAGPLESAPEVALLSGVAEARQSDVEPLRTEQIEEASDALCTPHCHDRNALSVEVPTTARSQRLERELVADPFNKHDRTSEEGLSRLWANGDPADHLPLAQTLLARNHVADAGGRVPRRSHKPMIVYRDTRGGAFTASS